MKIPDNSGKLIGEINVIVRPDGGVVTTNTVYNNDRVVSQTISSRDDRGSVKIETVFGGKILP